MSFDAGRKARARIVRRPHIASMSLASYVHRSPEVRKERAEAEIASTFEALRDGRLVYDDWVRKCLSHAIGADTRGLCDLAHVDGELARLPTYQRTMRGRRPYAP